MAGVAINLCQVGYSSLFCIVHITICKYKRRITYDMLVWRGEWVEGYLLPIVKPIKFHVFYWFCAKIHLFLKVLMAGVAINLCPVYFFSSWFFDYSSKPNYRRNRFIDIFVWRLDCRLKYVCYLLLMKFVIFGYF